MEQVICDVRYEYFLMGPGPRPPYREVAHYLWGEGCDFDSDGNSEPDPAATEWTELTITLRPDCKQRVDVDPIRDEDGNEIAPLILMIYSEHEGLASEAAAFLQARCGGQLKKGETLVGITTLTETAPGVLEGSSSPTPHPEERLRRSVLVEPKQRDT